MNDEEPPQLPHRRSIRLKHYDNSLAGAYFVTVCVSRGMSFGIIRNAEIRLNEQGKQIAWVWWELPFLYHGIEQDAFIIMPNHVHGILVLHGQPEGRAGRGPAPTNTDAPVPVGAGPRPARGEAEDIARAVPQFARDGARAIRDTQSTQFPSLSMIIRAFKSISARRINVERGTIGRPFWQRGYYEHIVRNEKELLQIRRYIELNPANWRNDRENPDGVKLLPSQPWQM